MRRPLCLTLVALMACGAVARAEAQLTKPPSTSVTVVAGPASLSAGSYARAQVTLTWPAVAGAQFYRLTRIANTGDPEATIAELTAATFVFEGASCAAGAAQPNCAYIDVSYVSDKRPISQAGTVYPHLVTSGALYTYRVWAILPGPVVSPPSPPATVRVR